LSWRKRLESGSGFEGLPKDPQIVDTRSHIAFFSQDSALRFNALNLEASGLPSYGAGIRLKSESVGLSCGIQPLESQVPFVAVLWQYARPRATASRESFVAAPKLQYACGLRAWRNVLLRLASWYCWRSL
jgi:hypothetical protein